MRNLLSFVRTPRDRAASERWGWLIDAHAAAYEREKLTFAGQNDRSVKSADRVPAPTFSARKGPPPLSRGSLAWACGDLRRLGVEC